MTLSSHRDALLSCSVHDTVQHSLVPFCDHHSAFPRTQNLKRRRLWKLVLVGVDPSPWLRCALALAPAETEH